MDPSIHHRSQIQLSTSSCNVKSKGHFKTKSQILKFLFGIFNQLDKTRFEKAAVSQQGKGMPVGQDSVQCNYKACSDHSPALSWLVCSARGCQWDNKVYSSDHSAALSWLVLCRARGCQWDNRVYSSDHSAALSWLVLCRARGCQWDNQSVQ